MQKDVPDELSEVVQPSIRQFYELLFIRELIHYYD